MEMDSKIAGPSGRTTPPTSTPFARDSFSNDGEARLPYISINPSSSPASRRGRSSFHGSSQEIGPRTEGHILQSLSYAAPPSFDSAQFGTILRRQRQRPLHGGGIKLSQVPSRFLNLSNNFEFAGWGTVSRVELREENLRDGESEIQCKRDAQTLGQLLASAFPGTDIVGGIFYTVPAVVATCGVLTPIALFVSSLVLFLFRPIMVELESALPISGAPYTYLLQVSSKSVALVGAALLLLDFASTVVVSAAAATSYISGEVPFPMPQSVGSIIILLIFLLVGMLGMKESARSALIILTFHLFTLSALIISGVIHWSRVGNAQLADNWHTLALTSPHNVARQIFNGICIGMLGLTGFECTPSYVASIKKGRFPSVLRNLHYSATFFNTLTTLVVVAIVPLAANMENANILSLVAETAAGRWLRILTVVDAVLVLSGGVLGGTLTGAELLQSLAQDRILPAFFSRSLPWSGAHHLAIIAFGAFSAVVYALSGFSLDIVSKMFSMVWLGTMSLFPISDLLLKFNRGRLRRTHKTSLSVIFLTSIVIPVVVAGNILLDPTTIGYAAAYVVVIYVSFSVTQKKARILHWVYWAYDQNPRLHTWKWSQRWDDILIRIMRTARRQPVCVLTRTDEINNLVEKTLYVSRYEETSCMKLVYFSGEDDEELPSELEANWKILDEAFPEITIDLVIVKAAFQPSTVAALARHLQIPTSLIFMACPGPNFAHEFSDFGTRIISL